MSRPLFRIISKRSLSSSTVINPKKIDLNRPNAVHKSLILLTTPSQLNKTVNEVIQFSNKTIKNMNMNQILVACVDTISGSRNGYSTLWLENKFNVSEFQTLDKTLESLKKKKDPLSSDPVKMEKNWKDIKEFTNFEINFNYWDTKINTFLSNTIFQNSENSTCFYIGNESFDFENLSICKIELPLLHKESNSHKNENINYTNKLTEIPFENDPNSINQVYTVTDFEGNLIKSINNESASAYLINNEKVMDSKKDLYFKLYNNEDGDNASINSKFYKLIVGGLGWGEKQAFIAVDPIVGHIGLQNVKLYYYDPTTKAHEYKSSESSKIIIECSEIQDGYEDYEKSEQIELKNVFSFGCELGVQYNGVWHRANGEVIECW